jgi:hypothetical protein
MKHLVSSFLWMCLLLVCHCDTLSQGNVSTKPPVRKFKHNSKVETIYDKAKDQSTVYLRPMTVRYIKSSIEARMISEGRTESLPAEMLSMTAYFISPGKVMVKPEFVVLGFRSMTLDQPKYTDDRSLSINLDGSFTNLAGMEIIERRVDARSDLGPNHRFMLESLELPIPYEIFVRITLAKRATLRLASTEFELKNEHLEAFRDLLSRVP